ncbi:CUGBP Elav-like family member 4 [Thelohanellus kitauei]|uniref:CUGBP Elav-like family member 4 n=1 Tax=Thelohanellus kitauei TaxID=669202 RepID=A0A0C2IYT7_THEKT|nr:CUGBP Elav-like family member 4 [Thelohanellus kitauei]
MSLTSCSYLSSPRRLFVGQLPRSFTDADLRKLFSDYGEILEANIITDKLSGISKGCGFVTYAQECSVTVAQENLHGRRILEGMSYPMYVKPADVGGITGISSNQ